MFVRTVGRTWNLSRCFGILAALVFLAAGVGQAAWVSLGGPPGSPVEVSVLENSPDRIVLHYVVPGFDAQPVVIDGKTYYTVSLPAESNIERKGLADLPHVCRSVIIPDESRMQIREVNAETSVLAGYPVAPSKGTLPRTIDPSSVPFTFAGDYGAAAFYPAERATSAEPYIFRDYRGLAVEIFPLQARGSDGALQVTREMTVVLESNGPDMVNVLHRPTPPSKIAVEFAEIYRNHFINWAMSRYVPVQERGKMLIITHDAFHSAVLPLVEWKQQEGIPTTLVDVSTIGNTSTAIDAYITNRFNTEGVAFVLLVGDGAQVATPHAGGGASDPTYATILGSDNYPEIFVGRFSAENISHVQTQVDRTIAYEKNPLAGGAWYHKGLGIGSNQGPGDDGEYDYQHIDVIRGKLLNYSYTDVDQIYDPGATAAMVTTALNAGRSVVNYCGHGDVTLWVTSGFNNNNVMALQNDNMLPFIFSVACVNGAFESTTCFAEAWMRSTHNGNPIGAIGTYMSSINQSWNPPMCGQDAFTDLLVHDQMRTFGGLCYNSSCQMMDEYGSDGQNMFLTWHIFGDPSLQVRTATPVAMTVQHNGAMFPGATDYAVTVPGVTGATCALYGNGALFGSAITNASGMCTIHMPTPPAIPMTLTLTATAYNHMPVQVPVEVVPPSGPYLVLNASTVLDGGGDSDGVCDADEANGLNLALRNIGIAAASAVTGTVTTTSADIAFTDATRSYGNIPAGATVSSTQPFGLLVSPNATDQAVVPLHLDAQAAEGSWGSDFSLLIHAPVLQVVGTLLEDGSGNSDGGADPGENLTVIVLMTNTGHGMTCAMNGLLSCDSPYVTITDASTSSYPIQPGMNRSMSGLAVSIAPDCPSPSNLIFRLALSSSSGYTNELQFEMPVGPWVDDAEVDRGWSLSYNGDTATSGQWVRVDPVGTTYNGSQAQTEDDHTAAPGAVCFVTGNGVSGGPAGDSDVDGGTTTLVSPVWDLTGAVSATVSYWRWYTNNLGNNPGADWWNVQVTADGTSWVNLEHTQASANSWTQFSFDLEDFVPLSPQVRVRFVADDAAPGSLVEAAVDDIMLDAVKPAPTGVTEEQVRSGNGFVSLGPNPLRSNCSILYRTAAPGRVEMGLYDVSGRLVRQLVHGAVGAGEHEIRADVNGLASGIYFVRLDTPQILQVRQVTVLR